MDITPGKNEVASKKTAINLEAFMHMFDGIHFNFPIYKHDHPPVIDVNEVADEHMTMGQRVADRVAGAMGSWRFIITQATIMAVWIMLNLVAWFYHWDIYPFVLLNLAMSAQAAFATPLIMMSQNRQSEKDRLTAQNDYLINCKGEEEVRNIMEHLDHQDTLILQIVKRLEEQHIEMLGHLIRLNPELARRLGTDFQQAVGELDETTEHIGGNSEK
jgi:uncharacterized membrane protein